MLSDRLSSLRVLFPIALALAIALGALTTLWALGTHRYQVAHAAGTWGHIGAQTFTVDSTADAVDAIPGNGVCDDGAGNCTLRAAIMEANALPGPDTIIFLQTGTYTLSVTGSGEDAALTGDLDIKDHLTIQASTIIDGGTALDRVFHIVSSDITVVIKDVTVQNGKTGGDGGGIFNNGGGTLTLTNSTVSNNSAGSRGGGIANVGGGTLTMTNTTVSANSAAEVGGGIFNNAELTTTNTTISNNLAQAGGGIFNDGGGTSSLINSTVSDNNATDDGGGIFNFFGTLTMTNSTVSGNSATDKGGGIFNFRGTLTMTNSTVSGNSATDKGGGIFNFRGTLTMTNSTVSGNGAVAFGGGGGIFNDDDDGDDGTVELKNTIVASNTKFGSEDCAGDAPKSLGHNLDSDGTCGLGAGDIPGVNPLLDPLENNGGPTDTHALMSGSPAIDMGNPDECKGADRNPVTTDQRGVARPVDGDGDGTPTCDIGAYEFEPLTLTVINVVDNTGGGTLDAVAFMLHVTDDNATGADVTGSPFSGKVSPGTKFTLPPGTYSVGENPVTGYTTTFTGDCTAVVLVGADTKTCTVTNTFVPPTLTVIKVVDNTGGGTLGAGGFTLHVTDDNATGADVTGSPFFGELTPGTKFTLPPGTYSVGEDAEPDYATFFTGDCMAVVLVGADTKTCTVTNTFRVAEGRMTGGGKVDSRGLGVSHGFTLHCDRADGPNNLQVNWGENKFHLEGKTLLSAFCSNNPDESEGKPIAGFDTFLGSGTGRLNGESGHTIEFTFTDFGEPGKGVDLATIKIDGVLIVSGTIQGNHQAHPGS